MPLLLRPSPWIAYNSIKFIFASMQERSLSEDNNAAETSDVVSAISNEECSVTSEILDKQSEIHTISTTYSQIHAAEMIQVTLCQ